MAEVSKTLEPDSLATRPETTWSTVIGEWFSVRSAYPTTGWCNVEVYNQTHTEVGNWMAPGLGNGNLSLESQNILLWKDTLP